MSEFNITIPGGESKRLKTGGKYCPADIVVTAEGGGGETYINPKWSSFAYFGYGRRYGIQEVLKYSDTANATDFTQMFGAWDGGLAFPNMSTIIPRLDYRKGTTFNNMFAWSSVITEIGEMDISNATSVSGMFNYCIGLTTISFVAGCIKISISFAQSDKLSDASIQSIIDGLADLSGGTAQTLTLHATVGAKLTDAQKASAAAKNWTLAY